MKTKKEYVVQYASLVAGEHEYVFEVRDKFFEDRDYSEIKQADITIHLNLLKQSTMMVLNFTISGTVKTNCDLCNAEFDLPIQGNYKLIAKMGGHEVGEDDDDIILLPTNEHELDLSQYLYEYISLSMPIKRLHPLNELGETTCSKEILNKLKTFLTDAPPPEDEDDNDPRWNDLKNISLN
ncbi:MAG: DUF177 domain-containing protein [Bacteroidia bacterium]